MRLDDIDLANAAVDWAKLGFPAFQDHVKALIAKSKDLNVVSAALSWAILCLPAFQEHLRLHGYTDLANYATKDNLTALKQHFNKS